MTDINLSRKPRVIFRADGNGRIGLGHVVRSLALAHMLAEKFHCVFAIQDPDNSLQEQLCAVCEEIIILPNQEIMVEEAKYLVEQVLQPSDIVVLDGYEFNTGYQHIIKEKGFSLVCIDDMHAYPFVADVIINHSGSAKINDYEVTNNTKLYLGLQYSLVRPEFLSKTGEFKCIETGSVFICLGGADPYNLTEFLIKSALSTKNVKKIYVVVGNAYQYYPTIEPYASNEAVVIRRGIGAEELSTLMQKAHVLISSASSVAIEALHVASGSILTGYYVDNQIEFSQYLKTAGLSVDLGNLLEANSQGIISIIDKELSRDKIESLLIERRKSNLGKQKELYNKLFTEICQQKQQYKM